MAFANVILATGLREAGWETGRSGKAEERRREEELGEDEEAARGRQEGRRGTQEEVERASQPRGQDPFGSPITGAACQNWHIRCLHYSS